LCTLSGPGKKKTACVVPSLIEGMEDCHKYGKNLCMKARFKICVPSATCTESMPVKRETSEGGILYPLIFLIYMEPFPQWLYY
jgi:hypothetical protein